ncbi:MAG TPA: HlyC/CorC family transporter [Steroidobacteraceae bacterium]|nr:HlyC/CorC family transporter [Steroidobacteraceae bacterium]
MRLTGSMPHPSLGSLFVALTVLLVLAAFLAGSETALMSVNRYRLRHAAKAGHRGARLVEGLLAQPDRLIGLILLLSTVVNVITPTLVGLIALRLGGDLLLAIGVIALTAVTLIFCEVGPKTFAALHPEMLAMPAAYVYTPLLRLLYPFVWTTNLLANGVLRLLGVSPRQSSQALSREELRTVVAEAGAMIPQRHRQMLVGILDLENVTVEDIMVPRTEIVGLDLEDGWDEILEQLGQSQHTRLPVFEGEIDQIVGVLHLKRVVNALARGRLDREALIEAATSRDSYFVPSGTTLNTQLLNFQRDKRRLAFVVDEYGDIQGLVALEDILEEIVGEFTTDPATMMHKDVHREADGSFVVNASTTVRALNRSMRWTLPTDGPKTLNGLIVEFLETIPEPGTTLKLAEFTLEVLQTGDNAIKTVRVIVPPAPLVARAPR